MKIFAKTIVKKAERLRRQNQVPAPQYSYEAYTKSAVRFPDYFPIDTLLNRTLFQVLKPEKESDNKRNKRPAWIPPDLDSEILYLSENLSEMYVREPRQIKEVIENFPRERGVYPLQLHGQPGGSLQSVSKSLSMAGHQ